MKGVRSALVGLSLPMRFSTLDDWLAWQEKLHHSAIDLGLDRVRRVFHAAGYGEPPFIVITVAGTNGKGSSVAFLESILLAAGYRVGAYTSPHLVRYNERIRVNGREADDARIVAAFERIDRARGNISLTYFEFGTLAALDVFYDAGLDVVLLEVGMGGRLDAVNILDADVALITSIGVDHTEWLGSDREAIGREKAGILRPGRPAVCADPDPPGTLLQEAARRGAQLYRAGKDYGYEGGGAEWRWWGPETRLHALPLPALPGRVQLVNAAAVLMVMECLRDRLPVSRGAVRRGLLDVSLPGRFQMIPGDVEWILDVAHNPDAACALAGNLAARPVQGRTLAVLGMLADKDVEGLARSLKPHVDGWYAGGLACPRGLSGGALAARLRGGDAFPVSVHASVAEACRAARSDAKPGDRVVVCGSFHTVAEAMAAVL